MNQYKCETCKHRENITDAFYNTIWCKKHDEAINPSTINLVGCASHSDFQSEREKVLELLRLKYVEFLNHPCPELADKYKHCCDAEWCGLCTLDEVLAELRQAGEPDA